MDLHFQTTILDDAFAGGYQIAAVDVDSDGKTDVIGLGDSVAWLASPAWGKRPITGDQTRNNIDIAPYDIDGDSRLEIVVASDFALNDSSRGGTIQWFGRPSDLGKPWTAHFIDSYPTMHRIRWADVEGTGRKWLVGVPILGRGAKGPAYDQAAAPIILYQVPKDPINEPWPKVVIDESLHVAHGVEILDFDGDGHEEILIACFEGIYLFQSSAEKGSRKWTKTRICSGEEASAPARGSSEVQIGKLKGGRRFIAAIEPWHGDKVVVYLPPEVKGALWRRRVIDSSFSEGHALAVFDFNRDDNDEIVAGFRGKNRGIAVYRADDSSGQRWVRSVVDAGGIACQGCVCTSLRGATKQGILAIGGATHNIKYYEFEPS